MWASDDSASSSPAPIRLKISEPVPPPIKLRIKRDRNDKWEAASSVSSYASDVNSVSGNDSNSEENGQSCSIYFVCSMHSVFAQV